MTIAATDGYTINSVTINFTVKDSGKLIDGSKNDVTSNRAFTVNASSVTFSASSSSGSKGKILITGFTINYTSNGSSSKTNTTVSFGEGAQESYTFDVNSEEAKSFTAPTATVKDADGNAIEGASVSYSSNNEDLATVDASTGSVTIKEGATGTATITASYIGDDTYYGSSASYTITVVNVVTNFADFKNTTETTKVTLTNAQVLYVKSNDMFVRDADGTCIDFYQSGLSFEAGDFISGSFTATYTYSEYIGPEATDITNISLAKTSKSTPEPKVIASSEVANHLCDLIKLEGAEVTLNSKKYYVDDVQVYDKFGLKYSLTANSNYNLVGIAIVYNNSTYEICPTETPTEVGATKITLSKTSFSFTTEDYTTFAAPTATVLESSTSKEIENATVTYESSNTDVASVTDNVVSLTGKTGKAKITVTYAGETNKYKSSTATYTIKVTEPGIEFTFVQTSTTAGTLSNEPEGVTAEFNNTYSNSKWQLTAGNSMTLTLSNLPVGYKVEGITLNVANNTSSGAGTATATVGESSIADELSIKGIGVDSLHKDMENVNCPAFTSESNNLTIKISATDNSVYCYKFIIKLIPTDAAEKISLTSSKKDWGTVCLPYTAQVVKGTTLYTVAGSSSEGILVEQKTDGILVAGTPYIYKAEGTGYFYKASNDEVTEPVAGANKLVGVLTASQLTGDAVDGIYILPNDGIWHLMGTGATVNLTKNRAYLTSLPEAVSEVKSNYAVIDTDGASAISGVNADKNATAVKGIYTLAGQRVKAITKGGIYIVNGKKVLVK